MTKEEFTKRCQHVLEPFEDKEKFDRCISEILQSGYIDLEKCPQNYIPVYWVMGALFSRAARECLDGSLDYRTRREAHREAKKIAPFIPRWF